MNTGNDSRPQSPYLIIVVALFDRIHREVHVKALAINVTQDMHQPSLDATSVHATKDVENADWPRFIHAQHPCG